MQLWAYRNPVSIGIDFYLGERDRIARKIYTVEPIILKEVPPETLTKPTFQLDPEAVQQLMDCLWMQGIRPSDGQASTGQLKATELHLQDTRNLNAKLLDVVLNQVLESINGKD
jgi:hypothetical protein